jgi:hypothetical protein
MGTLVRRAEARLSGTMIPSWLRHRSTLGNVQRPAGGVSPAPGELRLLYERSSLPLPYFGRWGAVCEVHHNVYNLPNRRKVSRLATVVGPRHDSS